MSAEIDHALFADVTVAEEVGDRRRIDVVRDSGLAEAVHELLSDHEALGQAREGARRAREELTWDGAAQAHLELYEEIA